MKKTTLVFDFDGTLADSIPFIHTIVNELARKYGFPEISRKDFESLRGKSPWEIVRLLHIPILKIGSLIIDGQQAMTTYMSEVPMIPGMRKVLADLRNEGYRFGIVTSNSKKNIEAFLDKNQLLFFEYVYGHHNIFGKQAMLKEMMKKERLQRDEILYFGDEVRDIMACRQAGIDICSVTWGWNTKKLIQSYNPQFIVDEPQQIYSLLHPSIHKKG